MIISKQNINIDMYLIKIQNENHIVCVCVCVYITQIIIIEPSFCSIPAFPFCGFIL